MPISVMISSRVTVATLTLLTYLLHLLSWTANRRGIKVQHAQDLQRLDLQLRQGVLVRRAVAHREAVLMLRHSFTYKFRTAQNIFIAFVAGTLFAKPTMHTDTAADAVKFAGVLFFALVRHLCSAVQDVADAGHDVLSGIAPCCLIACRCNCALSIVKHRECLYASLDRYNCLLQVQLLFDGAQLAPVFSVKKLHSHG